MPDLQNLLPIDALVPMKPREAAKGTLLVSCRDRVDAPLLLSCGMDGEEGGPMHHYHLRLANHGEAPFAVFPTANDMGLWLAVKSWRLLVDYKDLVSPQQEMPSLGQAFFSGGVPGFVAKMNYFEAYVAASGDILDQPEWMSGFIGFRRWRIVTDVEGYAEPITLFERVLADE